MVTGCRFTSADPRGMKMLEQVSVIFTQGAKVIIIREGVNGKKTFSFGHCPNHLTSPPQPQFGQLGPFFRTSKFKI